MAKHTALIKALIDIQERGSLSDYSFAKKLRIPRSSWQLVRTGKKTIGMTLLRAVSRTTPELDTLILKYLKEGANGQ